MPPSVLAAAADPLPDRDAVSLVVPWAAISLALGFIIVRRWSALSSTVAYRIRNRTLRGPSSAGPVRLTDDEWATGDGFDEISVASFLSGDESAIALVRSPPPQGAESTLPPPPLLSLASAAPGEALFDLADEEEASAPELPERVEQADVPLALGEVEDSDGRQVVGDGAGTDGQPQEGATGEGLERRPSP